MYILYTYIYIYIYCIFVCTSTIFTPVNRIITRGELSVFGGLNHGMLTISDGQAPIFMRKKTYFQVQKPFFCWHLREPPGKGGCHPAGYREEILEAMMG